MASQESAIEVDAQWKHGERQDMKSGANVEKHSQLLRSAILTLCLAIAGSSVLPIPYSFSQTGILAGSLAILTVALVNDYTSCILLDCALVTGCNSYEELSELAYGTAYKIFTQCCLLLLLFGNLCGSLTALGEVASVAIKIAQVSKDMEVFLTDNHGRVLVIALTILLVFPLCMLRKIRQLEIFGAGGFFVVILLIAICVESALRKHFPAIADGEFTLYSLGSGAPQAFGVFGFAFYIQPVILPLMNELPKGKKGVKMAKTALHVATFAFAAMIYLLIGFFGAARFGNHTSGNILENFKGRYMAIVDILVTFYLAFSYPTIHFSLRCSLDKLVAGNNPPFSWSRHTLETIAVVGGSLVVAIVFPQGSDAMFAITGSTAVCIVCYIMPVVFHFKLSRGGESLLERSLLNVPDDELNWSSNRKSSREKGSLLVCFEETIAPFCAITVGMAISLVSLYSTIKKL